MPRASCNEVTLFGLRACTVAAFMLRAGWCCLAGAERSSEAPIVSEQARAELQEVLEPHQLFSLGWPSAEEIGRYTCAVPDRVRDDCVTYLEKALNPTVVPEDLASRLVPMKRWGRPNKHYVENGGSDVFIARFEKGGYRIQITENEYNVVVVASVEGDEAVEPDPAARKGFAYDMAKALLAPGALARDLSEMRVSEKGSTDRIRMGGWMPAINIVERREGSSVGTARIGPDTIAVFVGYMTNGEFVRFEMLRSGSGPRLYGDPYRDRFSVRTETEDEKAPTVEERRQLLVDGLTRATQENDVQALVALTKVTGLAFDGISHEARRALAKTPEGRSALVDLVVEQGGNYNLAAALSREAEGGTLVGDPIVERLIDLLNEAKESDSDLRHSLAKMLGGVGDPRATESLMAAYGSEENSETRESIVMALGRLKDARALPMLRDAVEKDAASQVRLYAQMAICLIEGTDFEEVRRKQQNQP